MLVCLESGALCSSFTTNHAPLANTLDSRSSKLVANPDLSVSHSHTTTTRHPSFRNARTCTLSLAAFPSSFSTQKLLLFVGVVQFLHPLCRCQKQP